jgi:hypothetical protein
MADDYAASRLLRKRFRGARAAVGHSAACRVRFASPFARARMPPRRGRGCVDDVSRALVGMSPDALRIGRMGTRWGR